MNDTDQMMLNEVRSLERAIQRRTADINQLRQKIVKRRASRIARRPRRYSLEFIFAPLTSDPDAAVEQNFPAQDEAFTVDGGTEFWCASVGTSVRFIGEDNNGRVADVVLAYDAGERNIFPAGSRDAFFSFNWRIRDTGTDREWQNMEMPDVFLLSGHLGGAGLPAHGKMKGGSEIAVMIRPTFVRVGEIGGPGLVEGLFGQINQIVLHVSFDGHEVRR